MILSSGFSLIMLFRCFIFQASPRMARECVLTVGKGLKVTAISHGISEFTRARNHMRVISVGSDSMWKEIWRAILWYTIRWLSNWTLGQVGKVTTGRVLTEKSPSGKKQQNLDSNSNYCCNRRCKTCKENLCNCLVCTSQIVYHLNFRAQPPTPTEDIICDSELVSPILCFVISSRILLVLIKDL